MDTKTLVMESTTDTPEEMRVGLGLPPEETAAEETPATADASADATTEETPAVDATAGDATDGEPTSQAPAKVTADKDETPRNAQGQFASKKPASAVQKRIDKVTRKAGDAEARAIAAEAKAEALEKELRELRTKPAPAPVVTDDSPADPVAVPKTEQDRIAAHYEAQRQALGPKPKQEDFTDYALYLEARDEYVEKRATINSDERIALARAADRASLAAQSATRTRQQRVAAYQARQAAAKTKYADWDQVVTDAIHIEPHIFPVLNERVLRSSVGPDLQYYLGAHPDELAQINRLPADEALDRIIDIEASLRVPQSPVTEPAVVRTPPPPKRQTKAPEPPEAELGSAASVSATDPEKMTGAQYHAWRLRQQRGVAAH